MEKTDLYVETSIISYLTAKRSRDIITLAHQEITLHWWENYREEYNLFSSVVVLEEAGKGDNEAAARRLSLLEDIPFLELNNDVEELAKYYYKELSFPEKALFDSYHLALAVYHKIDLILTWNCAHLANEFFQRRFLKLNDKTQLYTPLIVTPEELVSTREEDY